MRDQDGGSQAECGVPPGLPLYPSCGKCTLGSMTLTHVSLSPLQALHKTLAENLDIMLRSLLAASPNTD